ncbi:hypothetical protein A3A05_00630 [Candidatus Nomurabacteria bacterium RIFCSPLOWO2_01_FULL_41_12]|uniref:LytR/CpsA/Psr regulator C-terminal domain-containing protein n=1 Tax=Candidatus Nomurabacteria bacterium RIFCSPLOWO2_01_FULL_41_12 TaxID=1801774 RepID=A0A1F6WVL1_9BACT|nr:MAG: hypothetical protein A3A05_00630 [Candidatus Nomurabacteria bacterium RIFCSPLOWO2_01_FULL_41_12]
MKLKDINFSTIIQKIKSMRLSDFTYGSVVLALLIVVIISFIYSANFIVKNINKIFSPGDDGNAQALNMENYLLVVKRLNLPVNTVSENTDAPIVEPVTPPIEIPADTSIPTIETPAETPESIAPIIDKKSITINILNSTTKKGVAATLAKALTDAGFSAATTGNEKKLYALTTIIVSDAKKDYTPSVLEVVSKSYPQAVTESASGVTEFDVTIIIGKE